MVKVNFNNSRNLSLVGQLYNGNPESIIVMVHGFTGDRHENGNFDAISSALSRHYSVFAFDFSGCGESDDDSLTVNKQVDDLRCALSYVKDKGYKKIGLFGHSLGGLVSLKNADQGIETMVLSAPVTNKIQYEWSSRYSAEQLDELAQTGFITKEKKGRKIVIDKQMLVDRETVDQEELFAKLKCPILIIHGLNDERVPYKDTVSAQQYFPTGSRTAYLDSGHNMDCLDVYIKRTVEWFQKYL